MIQTLLPTWLQTTFGVDKSLEECEILMISSFTPLQRANEAPSDSSRVLLRGSVQRACGALVRVYRRESLKPLQKGRKNQLFSV